MNKNARETINGLLGQGATIEELEEILSSAKAARKTREAQITRARKELLAAAANYAEAVDPDLQITQEDLMAIEEELIKLDKEIKAIKFRPEDEETIFKFLKTIGAV